MRVPLYILSKLDRINKSLFGYHDKSVELSRQDYRVMPHDLKNPLPALYDAAP